MRLIHAAVIGVVCLCVATCDDSKPPSSPSPQPPPAATPAPTPAPTPVQSRLELTGPSTIAPGKIAEFKLTLVNSDGTSADVTSSAGWCCHSAAVQVLSPGRFL